MISDVYFPRVNGVSTSIQTFGRELTDRGHPVTLVAPDYGNNTNDGLDVVRIPARHLPVDPEDRMLRRGAIRRLLPALRRRGCDLVHIQTPFAAHYAGIELARLLDRPVVVCYHTYFEQYLDKYLPWLPGGLLRFAARRFSAHQCNQADALVVPSSAMLEVLRGYGVTTPAAIIPTGISPALFDQGDGGRFRDRMGIARDRPVLVHVGRLALEKNVDFLLRILDRVRRKVPDVLLLIAGEGPARPMLELLVQQMGLNEHVRFVGYLARTGELQDCYRAGDIFVFSSHTETQGLVLLEAMALGVPVVSTALMGVRDTLRDGEGALVAEPDVDDFAAKTLSLLERPALRSLLSQRGRVYAQQWSASQMAERMIALYASVFARTVGDPGDLSPQPAAAAGTRSDP
jgi:1,2-diacylglycerol 3-alpha-glucosyltransferase